MTAPEQLVVFLLEGRRYALRSSVVRRVVRAVEITPLPSAPEIVIGVVNVEGRVLPVINVRKRFGLPDKDIGPDDHLIIARTLRRPVALAADSVTAVVEIPPGAVVEPSAILPRTDYLEGVAKLDDGMVLIHDLDAFLSLEEDRELEAAMPPA